MGKVLLHARVTPATGGCSDTTILSCTTDGYLNVHTDGGSVASGALSQNLMFLNSQAITLGAGAVAAGTQRTTLASNDPAVASLAIIDDAVLAEAGTYAKSIAIAGRGAGGNLGKQYGLLTGEGALADGVLRVSLATDDDAVAHLATIAGDTTAIETAVQIIDNIVGTDGSAAPTQVAVTGGVDAATGYVQAHSVDSAGVQSVQDATWSPEVDSVNGWAKNTPTSHAHGVGADTATVTVNGTTEGAADELIASTNVSTYRGFTLWVDNIGGAGAVAFTHVYVYASRDGTKWVCVDADKSSVELAADTLAATKSGICWQVTDNPGWRFVKCAATVASSDTTATGALSYQM